MARGCQSPSPGDCENVAERNGCRRAGVSVRASDGSTRPIKEGPQMARGGDSDQSANGSGANRAMAQVLREGRKMRRLPLVGKKALRRKEEKSKPSYEKRKRRGLGGR